MDSSLDSEFGDSSSYTLERQRNIGSLSLQSSKRGENGPVLQNRSESASSYTRGNQGRWDTRSSGSSVKDGDFHSDQESILQGLFDINNHCRVITENVFDVTMSCF